MIRIQKATTADSKLITTIGKASFLSAHGHSAPKKDINDYLDKSFTEDILRKDLENTNNQYYLIFYKETIAGYSKIVFNKPYADITEKNTTNLSRLYLLEEFYGLKLGSELFNFNIQLAKENNQTGFWLAVWVENQRAINFYKKMEFKTVGAYNFKISAKHSNPNHILYLAFE